MFAEAIGRPELGADPRFATDELRCRNEPALRAALEDWSRALPAVEAVARKEAASGPP